MKTKLSVSRCCCVSYLCSKPLCQYDAFDTYGPLLNAMMVNAGGPYNPIGGTDGYQVSDQLVISTSGSVTSGYGVYRDWGVSGPPSAPDFELGYSKKTYGQVEFINVGSGDLDVFITLSSEGGSIATGFHIYKGQTTTSTIDFVYDYWTTTSNTKTINIDSLVADADLFKSYRMEVYDGRVNPNNSVRWDFEWKAVIDGTIVLESMTGAVRNYPALSWGLSSVFLPFWCDRPALNIYHQGVPIGYSTPTTTWDNLKISVNGDETCIP